MCVIDFDSCTSVRKNSVSMLSGLVNVERSEMYWKIHSRFHCLSFSMSQSPSSSSSLSPRSAEPLSHPITPRRERTISQ